jgi:hypothetical protein
VRYCDVFGYDEFGMHVAWLEKRGREDIANLSDARGGEGGSGDGGDEDDDESEVPEEEGGHGA